MVVAIIKTTNNRRKNKLGFLPTSAFFYAFELGTKQKDQVVSIEPSSRSSKSSSIVQLVLRRLSNKGLIKILLGIKLEGGKLVGVSLKSLFKIGVSSKVFTVSIVFAIGGLFLAQGTLGR